MKTMRKVLVFMALSALLFSVSSCDFFRALVGRPTSEWIAEKEARIKADEELKNYVFDEMETDSSLVETFEAETMPVEAPASEVAPVLEEASSAETTVAEVPVVEKAPASKTPVNVKGMDQKLEYGYYIVVGAFSNKENAQKLADQAKAKGYEYVLLAWNNGLTAVALCPTNDLAVAYSSLENLSREPFCPKDAWIMDSNRKKI